MILNMNAAVATRELRLHLQRTLGLSPHMSRRVLDEVLTYFQETPEEYVCRRHGELREEMVPNPIAFAQIRDELKTMRFPGPSLSERQVRRLIYG